MVLFLEQAWKRYILWIKFPAGFISFFITKIFLLLFLSLVFFISRQFLELRGSNGI